MEHVQVENSAPEEKWQPRYVAYAAAHGRSPEAMLAHDREAYPGGRMAGFIIWIGEQWRAWSIETKERRAWGDAWSDEQHRAFDQWLAVKYPAA